MIWHKIFTRRDMPMPRHLLMRFRFVARDAIKILALERPTGPRIDCRGRRYAFREFLHDAIIEPPPTYVENALGFILLHG